MDNLRGIALMVGSMLGFALEDMFIKRASSALPIGQILLSLSVVGTPLFAAAARRDGAPVWSRALLHRHVLARNLGELVGTLGFVMAISLTPLTTATAIFQATPLVVTIGAATLLGERVGFGSWVAMLVGLVGVLVVIQPGLDGFEPNSLWAVLAVLGLSVRDVTTRMVPPGVSTMQLAFSGFLSVGLLGAVLVVSGGGLLSPTPGQLGLLGGALLCGIVSYWAITEAMRAGEVAVVTPFRYSRLLFALVIGGLVFRERPDAPTLAGAALVVFSGLYTLHCERLKRREGVVPS
ncbi:MAG: DMT family transporter [Polyangiales bacterium]|nr:DMT family transporter [Myxococcales bacterium]